MLKSSLKLFIYILPEEFLFEASKFYPNKHTQTIKKPLFLEHDVHSHFFSFDSIVAKQTILNLIFFSSSVQLPRKNTFHIFFWKIMKNDSANRWWKIQGWDFYHHVWLLWRIFFLFFFCISNRFRERELASPLTIFFLSRNVPKQTTKCSIP